MLVYLIIFATLIVFLVVLYKHTDELTELAHKIEKAYHLSIRFGQTLTEVKKGADQIDQIDEDLTKMVETIHDNLEAFDLQLGELKKLFLLGNTSLDLKEIIKTQPERMFDGNAFVQKFISRAKKIVEKKGLDRKKQQKFKSIYSRTLLEEEDHTREELLSEQH